MHTRHTRCQGEAGFTLVEVMIAMILFTAVVAATWKVLANVSTSVTLEEQRFDAIQNCRTQLSLMRDFRDTSTNPFPANVVGQWPENTDFAGPGLTTLSNEVIQVDYLNPAAEPLVVRVTSTWTNIRGAQSTVQLATVMSSD